jgi:hypothetical protein
MHPRDPGFNGLVRGYGRPVYDRAGHIAAMEIAAAGEKRRAQLHSVPGHPVTRRFYARSREARSAPGPPPWPVRSACASDEHRRVRQALSFREHRASGSVRSPSTPASRFTSWSTTQACWRTSPRTDLGGTGMIAQIRAELLKIRSTRTTIALILAMVELRGLEPLTPCLQSRCSSS